uniref:RING-type domain-containing protein n=1 Tax=Hyaloperonospora arabidopsidis (strain Emoy2) TaxID=559515 RepID=M4BUW7_HYAAE
MSDSGGNEADLQPDASQLSSSHPAIGDGQSYVNPQLLRHPPDPVEVTGSLLRSTSRSAMVDTTSSISRPFTSPSTSNAGGSADSAIVVHDADEQTAKQKLDPSAADVNGKGSGVKASVAEFPAVARKVLQPSDVAKLYGLIRQLHIGEEIDSALGEMCDLLRGSACKELLDLMPKVLNGAICEQFIEAATSHGLEISGGDRAQHTTPQARSTDMSTFFERLQQKKRKTYHGHTPTAAVIKDPQCFVCYDITRKAYASPQCGHICCHACWTKMEKDGFTSCPVCKVPIKLQQLSLIRAAKQSLDHHG